MNHATTRLAGILLIAIAASVAVRAEDGTAHAEPSFLTGQTRGEWLTSRVLGTTVVGASNETIGDVSDIVIGADGRAVALVIGVGGFLGLGEKTVAVPLDRLDLNHALGDVTASEGRRLPDKVVLRATRADLQAAPEFHSAPRPRPSLPSIGSPSR